MAELEVNIVYESQDERDDPAIASNDVRKISRRKRQAGKVRLKDKAGKKWFPVLAGLVLCLLTTNAVCREIPPPGAEDSLAVDVINTVVRVFEHSHTPVWKGYDLSSQKTLLYLPGHWAVLLNQSEPVSDYTTYPNHWPGLAVPAVFHYGNIDELAGQLCFDYEIDAIKTVAVPVYTEVPAELGPVQMVMFEFIVHEAFHQFQRSVFRDMESSSEEKYPILDVENNALAALEMLIMKDSIRQIDLRDAPAVRHLGEMFVAVREYRWGRAVPSVRALERAKELQEGSAKYVEARYVGILADLCRSGGVVPGGACEHASTLTVARYLEDDFDKRLEGNALSPEDVPRNRIYPVGASQCLLLDFLDVPWKARVEEGKPEFTLSGFLRESLGVSDSDLAGLLEKAKDQYGYGDIFETSRRLIENYNREYEEAQAAFDAQAGIRVEVELPSANLSRSRSSRGTRWTVAGGQRVLCERYIVYTLERRDPEFFLKVENTGVLEESIEGKTKRVVFYVPALTELAVDGKPTATGVPGRYPFQDLALKGDGVGITAKSRGSVVVGPNRITVRVDGAQ